MLFNSEEMQDHDTTFLSTIPGRNHDEKADSTHFLKPDQKKSSFSQYCDQNCELSSSVDFELCRCAAEGDASSVVLLLNHGASASAIDYGSRSALQLSAANGHKNVVEILLMAGADLTYRDRLGRSALDDALWEGHFEIQKIMHRFLFDASSK